MADVTEDVGVAKLIEWIDLEGGACTYGEGSPCEVSGVDGVMVLGWYDSRLQLLRQIVRCDTVRDARGYHGGLHMLKVGDVHRDWIRVFPDGGFWAEGGNIPATFVELVDA